MTYATLMVHLELGRSNASRLQVTGDLAERYGAKVIGIAAWQPIRVDVGDTFTSGELIERDLADADREMKQVEADFRSAMKSRAAVVEWRSTVTFAVLSDYIAREARSADLVITGTAPSSLIDGWQRVKSGDLVMQVGRPVVIVPDTVTASKFERVVVAWKDTRETRRAAFDALPLLRKASHIAVVEIADRNNLAAVHVQLKDVVAWLERHGVMAEPIASLSNDDDVSSLGAIVRQQNADIVVAGAYGHSRFQEWMLGGVTRDLLLRGDRCSLLSH